MSAYILSGVAQTTNELVHSTTGRSPYSLVYGQSTGILPLAMGDVVTVSHVLRQDHQPVPTHAEDGIFVCFMSAAVASVLVCRKCFWQPIRVHPHHVRLKGWQGLCHLDGAAVMPVKQQQHSQADELSDYEWNDNESPTVTSVSPSPTANAQPEFPNTHTNPIAHPQFVLARTTAGAVYPAQVIKRARLQLAALERDQDGTWRYHSIVYPKHDAIIEELTGSTAEEAFGPSSLPATGDDDNIASQRIDDGPNVEAEDIDVMTPVDDELNDAVSVSVCAEDHSYALAAVINNAAKGHLDVTKDDLDKGTHDTAMSRELERWLELGVLDTHDAPPSGVKPITTKWVLTWKLKYGVRIAKARLVAQGFKDHRDLNFIETYSGTANKDNLNLCLCYIAYKDWEIAKSDVTTAFLQAPIQQNVWIKLPTRMPKLIPGEWKPGMEARVCRAVYGLVDAPRIYTSFFKQKAESIGWIEIEESILIKNNKSGSKIMCTQSNYINNLQPELTDKEASRKLKEPTIESVNLVLVPRMQQLMGILGWAAKTQPQISYLFSELSRWSTKPSNEKLLAVRRALLYIKEHSVPLVYTSIQQPKLRVWSDASYKLSTYEGRAGYEFQVVEMEDLIPNESPVKVQQYNLVCWKSILIKRKLASTTSAELYALQEAVKRSYALKRLVEKLWKSDCPIEFLIDSNPLKQQLISGIAKSEPRSQGMLDYVREQIKDLKAIVVWVPTHVMLADRQTKLKLL
eukprot:GHVR01077031.1.p1 GENE.GHVR01077031.1~~GHVR01077031.1.p1  ORF type:complete len:741 (+),score=128.02 GHVR01077031.1:275-2497(+)